MANKQRIVVILQQGTALDKTSEINAVSSSRRSQPGSSGVPNIEELFRCIVPPESARQRAENLSLEQQARALYTEVAQAYEFLCSQFTDAATILKRIEHEETGWFTPEGNYVKCSLNPRYRETESYYCVSLEYYGTKQRPRRDSYIYAKQSLKIKFSDCLEDKLEPYGLPLLEKEPSWSDLREAELTSKISYYTEAKRRVYQHPLTFRLYSSDKSYDKPIWEETKTYKWLYAHVQSGITLSHIALLMYKSLQERDKGNSLSPFFSHQPRQLGINTAAGYITTKE